MTQNLPYKTFLLVGSTGGIGEHITLSILEKKGSTEVRILLRKESLTAKSGIIEKFKAKGAKIVEGDIKDPESLKKALQGVDLVASFVNYHVFADQIGLVKLAKEAGVKAFVPSEFGIDGSALPPDSPLVQMKGSVVKASMEAGLKTIVFYTGYFMDFLVSPMFGFDLQKGTVIVPGGKGDYKVSGTTRQDIGRFIAEVLFDPKTQQSKEKLITVKVAGDTLTWNEVIQTVEKATHKTLTRVPKTIEEMEALSKDTSNPLAFFWVLHILNVKGFGFLKGKLSNADYPAVKLQTLKDFVAVHFKQ